MINDKYTQKQNFIKVFMQLYMGKIKAHITLIIEVRLFLILVLSFFTASCFNNSKQGKVKPAAIHEMADTTLYAVIPYSDATKWVIGSANKPATLSNEEIASIDTMLNKAVSEHNNRVKNDNWQTIDSLSTYKRQLVPTFNVKGEKTVWVNCICDAWKGWRKQIIIVADGGICYFNLLINLTTGFVSPISVNGLG